jgi:hypothetical protein
MALFSLVDSYQYFGVTWYLHLLERRGSCAGKKWKVWIHVQEGMKNGCCFPWYLHKAAFVMVVVLKVNSHIPYRSHVVSMLFPYQAVPLRVYIVSFPFDIHSVAMFDSHMPCRARAMPRPCRSESDFSRPRYSTAWV